MSILVYRPIADHVHVKNTTARYINTTAPCRKEWHRNLSDILIIHLHREPDFQDRRGAASLRYRPASKSLFSVTCEQLKTCSLWFSCPRNVTYLIKRPPVNSYSLSLNGCYLTNHYTLNELSTHPLRRTVRAGRDGVRFKRVV